jgi:hypothetical protein
MTSGDSAELSADAGFGFDSSTGSSEPVVLSSGLSLYILIDNRVAFEGIARLYTELLAITGLEHLDTTASLLINIIIAFCNFQM